MKRKTMSNAEKVMRFGVDDAALVKLSKYFKKTPPVMYEQVESYLKAAESNEERRFRSFGKALIERMFGREVIFTGRAWFKFQLPGVVYTGDWYYLLDNGRWVIVEVKGSKLQSGYRDARTKLSICATLNPWFTFIQVLPDHGLPDGWSLEVIDPSPEFLADLLNVTDKIVSINQE